MEKYYSIEDIPYERQSNERILTTFSDLDYYCKGLEIGVSLLVANTNVGKSTFVQGVIARAIEQGYKVFSFAGEHTAQSFLQLLYHQNSTKKDYVPIVYKNWKGEDTNIVDWFVSEEQEKCLRDKFSGRLFIYSNKAKRDIDTIIESMIACHKEQGTRFFVIDNMISIDNISSNVFAEQTRITEKIRTFALNYKVIVLLVAHQRKNEKGSFLIDLQDVAGSQNISNKAYNVIVQYRVDMLNKNCKDYEILVRELCKCGFDIEQCDGVLVSLKTKGNGTAYVGIVYDKETKTYRQAPKITKTEADKILKTRNKVENQYKIDFENLENNIYEDENLPF